MSLQEYLQQRHAWGTVKRYLREIRLFFASVEHPETTGYQQVMDYIGALRRSGLDANPPLCAIKQYYSYLVAEGIRGDHPAKSIKLRDKRRKDIQLQDLFKAEELALLLERKERYPVLRNRNQIIISLLIWQGLTNGEVKNLEVGDIHLEAGTVYIKAQRKTGARTLKLHSRQIFWLVNYIGEDRPRLLKVQTQKLIISKAGNPENGEGISYLIECCRHLFPARKLNAKTIRQSVIANLLKSGNDLRVVQAFAGHKYPSATEKYKQTQVEALKQAVLKHHPLQ